jgi:hypothetical protein
MTALVILGPTTTGALTSTAYTFQPDDSTPDIGETTPQSFRIRIWADQDFHVAVGALTVTATTSDMPVAAELHGVEVVVPPNGFLSVVSAGIEGNFWATRVKHAS